MDYGTGISNTYINRRIIGSLFIIILISITLMFCHSDVKANDCDPPNPPKGFGAAWWSEYSSWCIRCGGTPDKNSMSCKPGSNWGQSVPATRSSKEEGEAAKKNLVKELIETINKGAVTNATFRKLYDKHVTKGEGPMSEKAESLRNALREISRPKITVYIKPGSKNNIEYLYFNGGNEFMMEKVIAIPADFKNEDIEKFKKESIDRIASLIIRKHELESGENIAIAESAESEGRFRTALTHYVNALQSVSEGSSNDMELRKKVIRLAQKIQPPPEVPEKAHRYMARGTAFAEMANDKDGFQKAVKEFHAATRAAPWMADAYYNLGIVQDKSGLYKQAMQSLEFYLLAAPGAPDAREVRSLIYKIEVLKEEAQRQNLKAQVEAREKSAKEMRQRQSQKYLLSILNGPWYVKFCQDFDTGYVGCNEVEFKSKWKIYYANNNRYKTFNFKFPGNGTAEFEEQAGNAGKGVVKLIATANGPELRDIEWECVYKNGHKKKAGFTATYNNQRSVVVSCERDKNSYNPTNRYRYIQFKKP